MQCGPQRSYEGTTATVGDASLGKQPRKQSGIQSQWEFRPIVQLCSASFLLMSSLWKKNMEDLRAGIIFQLDLRDCNILCLTLSRWCRSKLYAQLSPFLFSVWIERKSLINGGGVCFMPSILPSPWMISNQSPVFTTIRNLSLAKSVVPSSFKRSTIVGVPKNASPACLNDYRPVVFTRDCVARYLQSLLMTQWCGPDLWQQWEDLPGRSD